MKKRTFCRADTNPRKELIEKLFFKKALPELRNNTNLNEDKMLKIKIYAVIAIMAMFGSTTASYAATAGSHYPYGSEGVNVATVPPKGFHYRLYAVKTNPTKQTDDNGNDKNDNFSLDIFSVVHRFAHVTEKKILGGTYTYQLIVPTAAKDFSVDTPGGTVSDEKGLSVGDITIEPFALSWHKPKYDSVIALALIMPTGEYDADKAASPGLGYFSGMLTLGGTYYFDTDRTWTISALTRTIVNSEQKDTHVTPGSEFVVEYGAGKEFAKGDWLIRPGLAGAAYWQFTDDSDDGATTLKDERKEAYAVGPEINFMHLPTLFQINLRAMRDFNTKNTTEGSQLVLTLTKSW